MIPIFLILGLIFVTIFLLLFFFSAIFKLAIMFIALFFIYKYFPPHWKKFKNYEVAVFLLAGFIILLFLGKGIGFLSVGQMPMAIQPVIAGANLTPLVMVLIFIIILLGILYLHKRK